MLEFFVLASLTGAAVIFLSHRKKSRREQPPSTRAPKPPAPRSSKGRQAGFDRPGRDQPLKVIKFDDNRPPGDWVNWKIYSGWFEVAGTQHREKEVLAFLSAAELASMRSQTLGVRLVPDPNNQHDPNAIKVVGSADGKDYQIGFVPRDIASEAAKMPSDMPVAAELKQAKIGHSRIIVSIAGLIPPSKVRIEQGWEEAPQKKIPVAVQDVDVEDSGLRSLIERMSATEPLSQGQVDALHDTRKIDFMSDPEDVEKKIQERKELEHPLAHLQLPDGERAAFMKAADNDLGQQVSIVQKSFDYWLKTGEIPAPYYAFRIAVILRKAKRKDLEKQFLEAWVRHFPDGNGKRYADLVERARKMGIEVP